MYLASERFDTHPGFIKLKCLLVGFFSADRFDMSPRPGARHQCLPRTNTHIAKGRLRLQLQKVHSCTFTTCLLSSGTRIPRAELTPMGPFLDLSLSCNPDAELWKAAMKRKQTDVQQIGLGQKLKRKNMEVDDMGSWQRQIPALRRAAPALLEAVS